MFEKNRIDENILFIDASQYFEKGTCGANYIREEDFGNEFLMLFLGVKFTDRFSYVKATIRACQSDYNLNISHM
ncbi:hypothetical protein O9992_09545 [Vibrio lentus]|nr:hypothetical protein [Vibrio lentus]